ncbi:hypothetical protein Aperf_G00000043090 [Anoplocephala perfoliata]
MSSFTSVPPGPPKITFPYNPYGAIFKEGSQLQAECVATPPGHPVGALFWRWHFHQAPIISQTPKPRLHLGLPFHSKDFVQTISAIEDVPTSFYETFTNGELKAVLNIPNINRRYHAANLSCETAHDTGVSKRMDVNIKIQFPPQNLTISLKNNPLFTGLVNGRTELVAYAKENARLTFVCTTDEMYPDVALKWVLLTEDRVVVSSGIAVTRDEIKASTRKPGAFIRESEVTIKMMQRNQYGFLDCQAWYEGVNRKIKGVRLGIIYPPDQPIIKGLVNGEPLRVGESRRLTCECLNGHPPPELQWIKSGKPIASTFTQKQFRGGVSLDLEFIGRMEDNGAKIRCQAKNQAQTNVVKSEEIVLNIYFPVAEVKVSIGQQGALLAGEEVEISCEAGTANPPARLQWRYFHCSRIKQYMRRADHSTILLTSQSRKSVAASEIAIDSDELAQDCEMDERIGIDDPVANGSHGGYISRGRLILRPQWRDHLDIVTCLASNSIYNHFTKQNEVQLNVSFPPQFIGFQPEHVHSIVEAYYYVVGSSGTLDLIPYGNPSCESIIWTENGNPLKTGVLDPRTADFTSPSVKKRIAKLSGLYQIDELLVIWNIKRYHTTNLTIQAKNSLGSTQATFLLDVTFPVKISSVKNANVSLDNLAVLECSANGNPSIANSVFSWNRLLFPGWDLEADKAPGFETTSLSCNDVTRVNGVVKHLVKCENTGGYNMRSQLLVYNVTRDDVGLYVCTADNGIPPASQSDVKLFSTFPPEIVKQPKFAKVAAKFDTSADLQCFVRVEPQPRVVWQLNRRDQEGSATVVRVLDSACGSFVAELGVPCVKPASPKFVPSLKSIRPGYYVAVLHINGIHVTDFGQYTCKISTQSGEIDEFAIQVTGTGPPEVPFDLRLLNASATNLKIGWGQGFNGGYKQTFTVRWKSDNPDDQYRYEDVVEVEDKGYVTFTIHNLKQNTQYEIAVNSRNEEHGQTEYTKSIFTKTISVADDRDHFDGYHTIRAIGYSRSNSLFIIVAACVIGGVIILINIVVIIYIIKKRRTRGGHAAGVSSSKIHHVPLEKTYRGGPKYTGPYCDDPQHRHVYGEHLYVPDPLLMGEAAQSNPVYGYVPIGNSLSEVRDGVCQSAYLPTLYTGDPNYQQVHHSLSGDFQSPLTPVRPVDGLNTLPSTKYLRMASKKKTPKPFVYQRGEIRKRQSFGDSLNRPTTSNWKSNQPPYYHGETFQRPISKSQYLTPSYNFIPLEGQQLDDNAGRMDEHPDLLGYTENCYIDQLEALQKGNSPTKRLLLNGVVPGETTTRSQTSTNWNDTSDVVV